MEAVPLVRLRAIGGRGELRPSRDSENQLIGQKICQKLKQKAYSFSELLLVPINIKFHNFI